MSKGLTFEEAMQRLEQIVRSLEEGHATLDASLSSFEEAIALVKLCNEKLESAEQRVKILLQQDGEIEAQDFVPQKG